MELPKVTQLCNMVQAWLTPVYLALCCTNSAAPGEARMSPLLFQQHLQAYGSISGGGMLEYSTYFLMDEAG